MNTWTLDAIDPLFFGDGRSITTGAARGRILPPPQTLAGLVRSRQGLDANGAWVGDPEVARRIPVHGPFPALLDATGAVREWLFPRPADALLVEGGLKRLVPLDLSAWGTRANWRGEGVAPAGLAEADPTKPKPMNAFWRWSELEAWLGAPSGVPLRGVDLGVAAPVLEPRTHVAIDVDRGRALDGALFETAGRRMEVDEGPVGIGLRTEAALREGVSPAGGERRMVRWRRAGKALPVVPASVLKAADGGAVRVVLATPAIFAHGWRPDRLFDAPQGSTLVAACVGRPDVVSGWDLAKRQARPTRRCAPAGSVYFLRLGGDAAARRAWATSAWLAPRSDDEADRLDGYGCLLLGAWDGLQVAPSSRL